MYKPNQPEPPADHRPLSSEQKTPKVYKLHANI